MNGIFTLSTIAVVPQHHNGMSQKPVGAILCWFESSLGHHLNKRNHREMHGRPAYAESPLHAHNRAISGHIATVWHHAGTTQSGFNFGGGVEGHALTSRDDVPASAVWASQSPTPKSVSIPARRISSDLCLGIDDHNSLKQRPRGPLDSQQGREPSWPDSTLKPS